MNLKNRTHWQTIHVTFLGSLVATGAVMADSSTPQVPTYKSAVSFTESNNDSINRRNCESVASDAANMLPDSAGVKAVCAQGFTRVETSPGKFKDKKAWMITLEIRPLDGSKPSETLKPVSFDHHAWQYTRQEGCYGGHHSSDGCIQNYKYYTDDSETRNEQCRMDALKLQRLTNGSLAIRAHCDVTATVYGTPNSDWGSSGIENPPTQLGKADLVGTIDYVQSAGVNALSDPNDLVKQADKKKSSTQSSDQRNKADWKKETDSDHHVQPDQAGSAE